MILNNSYAFKMLLARFSTNTLVTRITQKNHALMKKERRKKRKNLA